MKQREKIVVAAGVAILALILVVKMTRSKPSSADASTIRGAIESIQNGDGVRRSVEGLVRELNVAIPPKSPAEQETQIRADLARKAQENRLTVISQKGIESSARGSASRSVQMVQYRLELFGLFDDVLGFINALEKSQTPFVVREFQCESSPRAPGENPAGGMPSPVPGGGMPTPPMAGAMAGSTVPDGMPPAAMAALANMPPEVRARAESMMHSRGERRFGGHHGSGGSSSFFNASASSPASPVSGPPEGISRGPSRGPAGMTIPPNGRVHATMRVQSYLFPVEITGAKPTAAGVTAAISATMKMNGPTSATAVTTANGGGGPQAPASISTPPVKE